jgi:hypothetical protein
MACAGSPADLEARVRTYLDERPAKTWDDGVRWIAGNGRKEDEEEEAD